jgi:hypothetical protein
MVVFLMNSLILKADIRLDPQGGRSDNRNTRFNQMFRALSRIFLVYFSKVSYEMSVQSLVLGMAVC